MLESQNSDAAQVIIQQENANRCVDKIDLSDRNDGIFYSCNTKKEKRFGTVMAIQRPNHVIRRSIFICFVMPVL